MGSFSKVADGFVPDLTQKRQRDSTRELRLNQQDPSATPPRSNFEETFLAHYSRIVGVLRRILGDHARAEDLASEVFLKLYQQPPLQNSQSNIPGWLYRTATNLGIDALRASARRDRFEQDAARQENSTVSTETGLDAALRSEREQRVRAILADLKPAQAQLLLLRATGYSYKELASALDLEANSVGTLLNRAEAAFEQRYSEIFGREEDL